MERANLTFKKEILSQGNGRFGILIAKNFGSHPIETVLEKKNLGIVYPYSGYFEKKGDKPTEMESNILLESGFDTFIDSNKNGKLDGKETKNNYQLGYALQLKNKKEGENPRVIIFSGTSWLTDQYFSLNLNSNFSVNSVNWVLQREILSGIVLKKTDIEIVNLTDKEKQIVWVIGMFAFPGLIILAGLGFVILRKKTRLL